MSKGIFAENAKIYSNLGYTVFPGEKESGKAVTYTDWAKYGTELKQTEEKVIEMINKKSSCNIGIVLGAKANLTVLDLDIYTDNKDECQVRELLSDVFKVIPKSPLVKMGSKGCSIFYKYSGNELKKLRRNGLEFGDILSDRKFCIMPPSVIPHKDTGELFTVKSIGEHDFDDYDVKDRDDLPSLSVNHINKLLDFLSESKWVRYAKPYGGGDNTIPSVSGVTSKATGRNDTLKNVVHNFYNSFLYTKKKFNLYHLVFELLATDLEYHPDNPLFYDTKESAGTRGGFKVGTFDDIIENARCFAKSVTDTSNAGEKLKDEKFKAPIIYSPLCVAVFHKNPRYFNVFFRHYFKTNNLKKDLLSRVVYRKKGSDYEQEEYLKDKLDVFCEQYNFSSSKINKFIDVYINNLKGVFLYDKYIPGCKGALRAHTDTLDVKDVSKDYVYNIFKMVLTNGLRKAYQPSIQNPMILLGGVQGAGKDSFIDKMLASLGDYYLTFTPSKHGDRTEDDRKVVGKLFLKIEEADQLVKMEETYFKSLLTAEKTMIRPLFKDFYKTHYSCTTYIGTLNKDEVIEKLDTTGLRRFIPLKVLSLKKCLGDEDGEITIKYKSEFSARIISEMMDAVRAGWKVTQDVKDFIKEIQSNYDNHSVRNGLRVHEDDLDILNNIFEKLEDRSSNFFKLGSRYPNYIFKDDLVRFLYRLFIQDNPYTLKKTLEKEAKKEADLFFKTLKKTNLLHQKKETPRDKTFADRIELRDLLREDGDIEDDTSIPNTATPLVRAAKKKFEKTKMWDNDDEILNLREPSTMEQEIRDAIDVNDLDESKLSVKEQRFVSTIKDVFLKDNKKDNKTE